MKTKIGEHIPSEYSISTILASDNIDNKHILYRKEDFMQKYVIFLWKKIPKNVY